MLHGFLLPAVKLHKQVLSPVLSGEKRGIGFRIIHKFNLSLLAKQSQRLVQFSHFLVVRVLRGKYYRLNSPYRYPFILID